MSGNGSSQPEAAQAAIKAEAILAATDLDDPVKVPLVGRIAAGVPVIAEEEIEDEFVVRQQEGVASDDIVAVLMRALNPRPRLRHSSRPQTVSTG